jgi:biopolymer transport protein ExbB
VSRLLALFILFVGIHLFAQNTPPAAAPAPAEVAAQEPQGVLGNNVWETLQRGGEVMYAILAASILGLTFFMESMFRTRRSKLLPRKLENALKEDPAGSVQAVLEDESESCLQVIVRAGHQWRNGTTEQCRDAIEEASEDLVWQLKRGARPIGVIANTAPLLGLLGTVIGIVEAFDTVSRVGLGNDPAAFAGGISKALLTTCFGLIVAIPMLLAFHYLNGKIEARLHRCEELAKEALLLPPE